MKNEALKLALEAMTYADACLKKQLTMKYKHEYAQDLLLEAGTAIKEALANEALEKMAENARELGLDYEPEQTEHGWTPERIAGMARLKEAQDKKLAQLEQEPVGEIVDAIEGAFKCSFTKMLPVGTKLYTTPPQRKPLTDEEIDDLSRTMVKGNKSVNWLCQAIEAAHNIKENT